MKSINLTPENFVDIIILGLFWEHWPPKLLRVNRRGKEVYHSGWTTVDHILSVLKNLGLVTDSQIQMIRDPRAGVQHHTKFRHHCGAIYGLTQATDRYSLMLYHGVTNGTKVSSARLMRNVRIQLIHAGVEHAKLIEEKFYETGLNKEVYLAEAARIDEMFKTYLAHGIANKKYRERVDEELESLDDN